MEDILAGFVLIQNRCSEYIAQRRDANFQTLVQAAGKNSSLLTICPD